MKAIRGSIWADNETRYILTGWDDQWVAVDILTGLIRWLPLPTPERAVEKLIFVADNFKDWIENA